MILPEFPLFKLPFLAQQHVFRIMDETDLITVSLCSKLIKNLVTSLKIKSNNFRVTIKDSTIEIYPGGRQLWMLKCFYGAFFKQVLGEPCRLESNWYRSGTQAWEKEGFGVKEWVKHLLEVFNHKTLELTFDGNFQDLKIDTLQEIFNGFVVDGLNIVKTEQPITYDAQLLEIFKPNKKLFLDWNPYTDMGSLYKILSLELDSMEIEFKINPNHVPVMNCTHLTMLQADLYPIDIRVFLTRWVTGWNPKMKTVYFLTPRNGPYDAPFLLEGFDYQYKDELRPYNQTRFSPNKFRRGWYEIKRTDETIASFHFTEIELRCELFLYVTK